MVALHITTILQQILKNIRYSGACRIGFCGADLLSVDYNRLMFLFRCNCVVAVLVKVSPLLEKSERRVSR